jgi:hypothetical protein
MGGVKSGVEPPHSRGRFGVRGLDRALFWPGLTGRLLHT